MNYDFLYSGEPLSLEGYFDECKITNKEDNSSTSGWIFCLKGKCHFMGF